MATRGVESMTGMTVAAGSTTRTSARRWPMTVTMTINVPIAVVGTMAILIVENVCATVGEVVRKTEITNPTINKCRHLDLVPKFTEITNSKLLSFSLLQICSLFVL